MLLVTLEPEGETRTMEQANTVLQLLNRLGLSRTQALVIRDDGLLTPDERLFHEDRITVRTVTSRG